MQEHNVTETTTATTIFLREDQQQQQPVALKSRNNDKIFEENNLKTEIKKEKTFVKIKKPEP